jgi:hypothetical protein
MRLSLSQALNNHQTAFRFVEWNPQGNSYHNIVWRIDVNMAANSPPTL